MQIFQCHLLSLGSNEECVKGSRDGVVVVALASHPRGAGSIKDSWPRVGTVGCLRRQVFLRILRFFPLLKNQLFQILIWSDAGPPWKPLSGEWSFPGKYH